MSIIDSYHKWRKMKDLPDVPYNTISAARDRIRNRLEYLLEIETDIEKRAEREIFLKHI